MSGDMTKDEIVARRKQLEGQRREANAALERIRLECQLLYTYCEHLDKYQYSAMGELGWKCPDCGWQT